jgi:glutamyl-Q tRNA(Asp) synthetase
MTVGRADSMNSKTKPVKGRFAPSPTGPLHFGSLVAAVGSYLSAKSHNGEWLVRMEDLDPPREAPGAADDILRTLEACGFEWDGEVLYQSRRRDAYETALEMLRHQDVLYACGCTRREIADSSIHGIDGPVYPGTCRTGLKNARATCALRVRTDNAVIEFDDRIQGVLRSRLESEVGDFVVRRADGVHAYQLAVVVDDAAQGITEVVRGADLLASTARQIHLQRVLGLPTPRYLHLPAALNAAGEKLSKQTYAPPLPKTGIVTELWRALDFLGQSPPPEWRGATPSEFWTAASSRWSESTIPQRAGIMASDVVDAQ